MARYSVHERARVVKQAKAAALSVNEYIRAVTLGAAYRPPLDPDLRTTLLALKRELTAQGNNLNQIARHVNAMAVPSSSTLRMLEPLAANIGKTLAAIRTALCRGEPAP